MLQNGKTIKEIGEVFNLSETKIRMVADEAIKTVYKTQNKEDLEVIKQDETDKSLISNDKNRKAVDSNDNRIYRIKLSILAYLDRNPGSTSKIIANYLNINKMQVEDLLYTVLEYECMQDDYGNWYLRVIRDHWWFLT